MPQPRSHVSHAARQAAYRRRREEARRSEQAAKGLPSLPVIAGLPGTVRWRSTTLMAVGLLNTVADEMEMYFDERSEAWQESERGEARQERTDAIRQIVESLEDVWS